MKKTLLSFAAAALLALSIVSCKETGTSNYQQVIPADASAIFAIRAQQMSEKAEMSEAAKAQVLKVLKDGLKSQNVEKLEEIFKNPEASGISLKEPVVVFATMKDGKGSVGIAAKVMSQSKLNNLFSTLQNEGVSTAPEKKSGYSEAIIENTAVCAYNDNSLLILATQQDLPATQEQAAAYMNQSEQQSALSNEFFKKALSKETDLSCCVSMSDYWDTFFRYYAKNLAMPFPMDSALWTDIYMAASLNFEVGDIAAAFTYESADKSALKRIEDVTFCEKKQNNTFLNRFPASTLYYVGLNVNGEKLTKYFDNQFKGLPQSVNTDDLKKLLSSIHGDFSFGLTKLGVMGIPSVLAYAEVKDNYPLTYIQEQLKDQVQFIPNGNDAYKMIIPMLNMTIYVGIQNNQFYMTNDPELYSRIDKPADKPLGDSPQGKELKSTYSCALINFAAIRQLPIAEMMIDKMGPQGQMVKNALEASDYMNAYAPTLTTSFGNFYLQDKTQNSLKVITGGLEQLLPIVASK